MRGLANLPENRTVASVPLAKSKNRDPKKPTEILRCASVHREVPWPRVRARCKNRIGSLGMPSCIWGNQWKRWVFFFLNTAGWSLELGGMSLLPQDPGSKTLGLLPCPAHVCHLGAHQPSSSYLLCLCGHRGTIGVHRGRMLHEVTPKLRN